MKNFSVIIALLVIVSLSVLAQHDPPTLGSVASPDISSGYTASTLYNMNIKYTESTFSVRAFQIVISNPTNPGVIGTAVPTDPNKVSVVTQGNNIIITSTDTTGNVSWLFRWTTPASNETIEFEIIATGMNVGPASNIVYTCTSNATTSSFISSSCSNSVTGVAELSDKIDLNIYPNPVAEKVSINYVLDDNEDIAIELFDITGKKIESFLNANQVAGSYSNQFNLPKNLVAGSYFVRIKVGEAYTYKQIMKL